SGSRRPRYARDAPRREGQGDVVERDDDLLGAAAVTLRCPLDVYGETGHSAASTSGALRRRMRSKGSSDDADAAAAAAAAATAAANRSTARPTPRTSAPTNTPTAAPARLAPTARSKASIATSLR